MILMSLRQKRLGRGIFFTVVFGTCFPGVTNLLFSNVIRACKRGTLVARGLHLIQELQDTIQEENHV